MLTHQTICFEVLKRLAVLATSILTDTRTSSSCLAPRLKSIKLSSLLVTHKKIPDAPLQGHEIADQDTRRTMPAGIGRLGADQGAVSSGRGRWKGVRPALITTLPSFSDMELRPTYCSVEDGDQERVLSSLSATETLLASTLSHLNQERRLLSLVQRRAQNSKLPIHRLPDELLSIIFMFAYGARNSEKFEVPMEYSAVSVCSTWRYCIFSTHNLWNVICISGYNSRNFSFKLEYAAQLASRSGLAQPLDLHLQVACYNITLENLNLLSKRLEHFLPRVESLFLKISEADYNIGYFPLPIDVPSLRTLRISAADYRPPDFRGVERIFEYPTPGLETVLALQQSYGNHTLFSKLPFSSFPSIRHLNLLQTAMDNDQVFNIIAALPNLEVLAWVPCPEDTFHPWSPPVHLPNLKRAFLDGGDPAEVLSSIIAPRLETLHLVRGSWKSHSALALGALLRAGHHFPAMEHLTVDAGYGGDVSLSDVLALPALVGLQCGIHDDVQCAELFQGLRLGRSLERLNVYLELFDKTMRYASHVSADVFVSHLFRFMEWRRASPKHLHRLGSIRFDNLPSAIPSLGSLCAAFPEDSLEFLFRFNTSGVDSGPWIDDWWRSNTSSGNIGSP